MSDEEIWQVITYIRSVEKKASAAETGGAAHGKELFYGAAGCGTCHMMNGKGGRLGPDLSSTGASRSVEYLTESLRNPSKRLAQGISEPLKDFSEEYETVTVVTSDGTKLQGLVLNEMAVRFESRTRMPKFLTELAELMLDRKGTATR